MGGVLKMQCGNCHWWMARRIREDKVIEGDCLAGPPSPVLIGFDTPRVMALKGGPTPEAKPRIGMMLAQAPHTGYCGNYDQFQPEEIMSKLSEEEMSHLPDFLLVKLNLWMASQKVARIEKTEDLPDIEDAVEKFGDSAGKTE